MGLYGIFSRQTIRFGIVGVTSNIFLYLVYLLLARIGVGYKTAMTLLFVVGALQTFMFNKRWTFEHQGLLRTTFIKYVITYSLAYLSNLAALLLFVDILGYPHQAIQGMMILFIAAILFLVQRHWIFRESASCN